METDVPAELLTYTRMVGFLGMRQVGDSFLIRGELPPTFDRMFRQAARQYGFILRRRTRRDGTMYLIVAEQAKVI